MRMYLGVDPGKGGGLAALLLPEKDGALVPGVRPAVAFKSMPETELGVWKWIISVAGVSAQWAAVEQVQGYIGRPHPGSSMFEFGASYGGLRMALVAAGFRFSDPDTDPADVTAVPVPPRTWQSGLGISPRRKSEDDTSFKNRLKDAAGGVFPDLRITLATADALLIAEYLRRLKEGEL